jgi:hypothetical protein
MSPASRIGGADVGLVGGGSTPRGRPGLAGGAWSTDLSTQDRDLVAQDKDLGVLGCLRSGQQSEPAQELAEDQVEESERHAGNDRGPPHLKAKAAGQRQGPGFRHRHAAQGLLVEHLFATTLANRLQAITNWRTWPSSERWSASDSAAKASCVASPSTVDAGTTECSTPAFGTTPPDYPRLAAGRCDRSSGE